MDKDAAKDLNDAEALKPKPKKLWKWILLIVGVIVIIFVIWFGFLIYSGFKNEAVVKPILIEYIQDLGAGNLNVAYNDLSSNDMKNAVSFEQFQEAVGVMPCLYTGFQSLNLSGFNVQATNNGTFYTYTGTITYSNGDRGALSAILEKDNGEFKVYGLHINITPERFKSLCENQSSTAE